jgi:hypothetical protein
MRQTSQNRGFCAFEVRMRRRRKRPTGANFKLQVVLLVSPRLSYKLVWVGRKERPAVQKATATAPWTLSTLERKGTRHHTCALRSPARESAYRHYVICTYIRDDDPAPWPETHTVIHLLAITLLYCVLELLIHILHPFDIASHAAGRPPERSASAHQQRGTTVPWDPLAARFARQPWC